MKDFTVTDTQLFVWTDEDELGFSINYVINNDFLIQLDSEGEFTIPASDEATWNNAESQDDAAEKFCAAELAEELELPTDTSDLLEQFAPEIYGESSAKEMLKR